MPLQTVACATTLTGNDGEPEYQIYNFQGSSGWSDNEVAGIGLADLKAGEVMDSELEEAFRESYDEYAYYAHMWENEDGSTTTYAPCKASLDLPKIGRDTSYFTEYDVTTGMRVYS